MMQPPHLFDTHDLAWTTVPQFSGLLFKPLETIATHPYARVALVKLPVGYTIPTHVHAVEIETIYVLTGQGELFLDGEVERVGPGQGGSVPVGMPHGLRNAGDTELELLAIHVRVVRAED